MYVSMTIFLVLGQFTRQNVLNILHSLVCSEVGVEIIIVYRLSVA